MPDRRAQRGLAKTLSYLSPGAKLAKVQSIRSCRGQACGDAASTIQGAAYYTIMVAAGLRASRSAGSMMPEEGSLNWWFDLDFGVVLVGLHRLHGEIPTRNSDLALLLDRQSIGCAHPQLLSPLIWTLSFSKVPVIHTSLPQTTFKVSRPINAVVKRPFSMLLVSCRTISNRQRLSRTGLSHFPSGLFWVRFPGNRDDFFHGLARTGEAVVRVRGAQTLWWKPPSFPFALP